MYSVTALITQAQTFIDLQESHIQHLLHKCAFNVRKTKQYKILYRFHRASEPVLSETFCITAVDIGF